MAIDMETERIIPLAEGARHCPGRPHISTIYRWAQRRVDPLETLKVGGRRFTSIEAIRRFVDRCTDTPDSESIHCGRSRERQIRRAEQELDAAGI